MPKDQPFEIPHQLRQLAEINVEQARVASGQLIDAIAQAMAVWAAAMPSNEMATTFKAIHERTFEFAKQNADAYFAFASELAEAKDLQDAFALHSRYAQAQMQTYTVQAQELGRLMADAAQSIQPRT